MKGFSKEGGERGRYCLPPSAVALEAPMKQKHAAESVAPTAGVRRSQFGPAWASPGQPGPREVCQRAARGGITAGNELGWAASGRGGGAGWPGREIALFRREMSGNEWRFSLALIIRCFHASTLQPHSYPRRTPAPPQNCPPLPSQRPARPYGHGRHRRTVSKPSLTAPPPRACWAQPACGDDGDAALTGDQCGCHTPCAALRSPAQPCARLTRWAPPAPTEPRRSGR